jgi:hypothetical protein
MSSGVTPMSPIVRMKGAVEPAVDASGIGMPVSEGDGAASGGYHRWSEASHHPGPGGTSV